jgi:formate dehydrogenase major subunit
MSDKLNIILNGNHLKANKGDYILDVAKQNNIKIPTLCNDPRLEPFSSCFVCVVEVEGMNGLQTACSTKVMEGMKIITDNEKVVKSRKSALDLIMSNHYADCVAPCTETCPAGVDVQGYISLIEKGLYKEAVALIKETNPLPAICGRVCVRPCEDACRRNYLDEGAPVGIDYMKRFAADWDLNSDNHYKPEIAKSTAKKIAIIGAGPSGLSAAYFLQQKGHQCDIFEAAEHPGGWLRYGIPAYRLPNELLDHEISTVTELGANIYCNKKLGDNLKYEELKKDYDAVILTIGSQKGTLVGAKGEDAENVFSGIDFLRNMEQTGKPADFKGKKVVVVGGGNTAMDCCRTAIRCGSDDVKVVYRRTEKEMPANPIEIHESKLEGVEYLFLNNPIEIIKDENGKLKAVKLIKMELGEPDASGRRRPVPIEGSEYEIEADYLLAAIGQKTDADFIDDINSNIEDGKLELNRWNDIDANPKTLQTGVKSIFAAGDGVTGPATIIEAINQAQIASLSAHQFVMGEVLKPKREVFVSKKDNFKKLEKEDFAGKFQNQKREEMPVLDAQDRFNFNEVELGYQNESIVKNEANRCMECGCGEFFDCDLQIYADEYQADQKRFAGEFNEYNVDFRHDYIEIDNNKCILCSKCIRACDEIVGATALGLINRGFDTFVAPSMGKSLMETNCESCGICIDICPTGAISENFLFKPGPVKVEKLKAIDNYGSEGVSMNLLSHKNKFVMEVEGAEGYINKYKTIGRRPKFGYKYLNDKSRITKPLLKKNGKFEQISFTEAFNIIKDKIENSEAEANAFFAGARLTNEELFQIQKFARQIVKTDLISNFHYLDRVEGYRSNDLANTPFEQIEKANKIYLIGAELIEDNDYVGFLVNNARKKKNAQVNYISTKENSKMLHKVDSQLKIKDYFSFVRAVNHYFISANIQNQLFIDDNTKGFEAYKKAILKNDFESLCEKAGVSTDFVKNWANGFNRESNAIIIFSEKYISGNTSRELYNLALISGKLGKTASGLIPLKTKNNSQGLFDMGVFPCLLPGGERIKDIKSNIISEKLENNSLENIFVFGEDPIGCAIDKSIVNKWFDNAKFVLVQDYFLTETAEQADLILPANFPIENSGSFTNTQKVLQQFDKQKDCEIEFNNLEQINELATIFGFDFNSETSEVFEEILKNLPIIDKKPYKICYHEKDNYNRLFDFGCDNLMKRIDEEMKDVLKFGE